jgi:hypothetical protein
MTPALRTYAPGLAGSVRGTLTRSVPGPIGAVSDWLEADPTLTVMVAVEVAEPPFRTSTTAETRSPQVNTGPGRWLAPTVKSPATDRPTAGGEWRRAGQGRRGVGRRRWLDLR